MHFPADFPASHEAKLTNNVQLISLTFCKIPVLWRKRHKRPVAAIPMIKQEDSG
jgi:hypothetical protein